MPDETDPLAEYEKELADIVDPSPWTFDEKMDEAQAIALGRSLGAAILAVVPDIITNLNNMHPPCVQYFFGSTGCVIEADAVDERHIHFCIKMPPTGPAFFHGGPADA